MRDDDVYLTELRSEVLGGGLLRLELTEEQCLTIGGQQLRPDATKGYMEFLISHGLQIAKDGKWSGVTAYGTAMHPRVVAASHGSMLHQNLNEGHLMKRYDPDKINRDHIIGAVVAVEHPEGPWTLTGPGTGMGGEAEKAALPAAAPAVVPRIRGVAALFKMAQGVPKLLAEHLSGQHRWAVSHEVNYKLGESGYLVGRKSEATGKQREYLDASVLPEGAAEFADLPDAGYVPFTRAPEDLQAAYNDKKRMVDRPWGKLPVVLLKGGLTGTVHYQGVGAVRYPAEAEARIQTMMAGHPGGWAPLEEAAARRLAEAVQRLRDDARRQWGA